MGVYLVGAVAYFYPFGQEEPAGGLLAGGAVVVANAASALLGREINRSRTLSPLTVTCLSMGIGSVVLLALGVAVQGLPRLDPGEWAIIGWLALVNSALAFTLWNTAQRTLTATQSSVINNTMLIQIAILAWVALGERLTTLEVAGLALAAAGILAVQMSRPGPTMPSRRPPTAKPTCAVKSSDKDAQRTKQHEIRRDE
jgi:drug/metabolite transporter (DMT)-like permease